MSRRDGHRRDREARRERHEDARARAARRSRRATSTDAFADHVLKFGPGHPEDAGDHRRGERHGRAHGAADPRAPADRRGADVLRARRQLPEPRGEPDEAREHRAARRAREGDAAPTSASRSTATPTACVFVDEKGDGGAERRDHGDLRAGDAEEGAGRQGRLRPALEPRRRRHRPRDRRRADPRARRPLVHQGDDAEGRRRARRRALGPLLLPRPLLLRLGRDRDGAAPLDPVAVGQEALGARRARRAATSRRARSTSTSRTRTA